MEKKVTSMDIKARGVIKSVEENVETGVKIEKLWDNDGDFFDYVIDKWWIEIIVVPWH